MNGSLVVQVFAENETNPVKGATVRVYGNGIDQTYTTDWAGKTPEISLPTPDTSVAGPNPYALYNVDVTALGLVPKTIQNIEVFPAITSMLTVDMDVDQGGRTSPEVVTLPLRDARGDQAKIPEDPDDSAHNQDNENPRVLPEVCVPGYIIVHDGTPSNANAANYYVPYKEYIKNVLSSEIYPTWNEEAIRANAYAVMSLTMNRVWTEWYPSKGYPFTITSSTQYDQKFIPNREIFSSISKVVDEIWDSYICRTGKQWPFFSQYNNGTTVNNPGWLSQTGSQTLAQQGYSALQILRYYYGSSVNICTAPPCKDSIPSSYPGYTLTQGECNDYVQHAQNMLNVIRSAYPGIPIIPAPNGNFDATTANAVKVFQGIWGLPQTGNIDRNTWNQISAIYTAIAKLQY